MLDLMIQIHVSLGLGGRNSMYRGFELKLSNAYIKSFIHLVDDFAETTNYEDINEFSDSDGFYKNHYENARKDIQDKINSFLATLEGQVLDADQIKANFFPESKADIFLSHTHSDESLALRLKFYLERKYKLRVFDDSTVWGSADKLLYFLDNKYNKTGDETYGYRDSNYTASNVYLLLASAIDDMMDKSECIMFLNTENSVLTYNRKDRRAIISAPWISHELFMTKVLRKHQDRTHFSRMDESVQMTHTMDLSHLGRVDDMIFQEVLDSSNSGTLFLDELYRTVDLMNGIK